MTRTPPDDAPQVTNTKPNRVPGSSLGVPLALGLSLLAAVTMVWLSKHGWTAYIPVLTLWLLAAICYVARYSEGLPSRDAWRAWRDLHRFELLGIGLVTLLAFGLRFYQLGTLPSVLNGDEGRVGLTALSTSTHPYVNPFALWENFGGVYLRFINLMMTLFGVSPFSLRLAAAIGGTLAVPALYLLARQISGQAHTSLVAAGLLAISPTHIHFSRTIAVAYIQGTWLIPLELYLLLSGLDERRSWRTALAGVLLAIHFSVYLDSQIIVGLILVFMLAALLTARAWFRPALRQASVFWGGFGIMILPEAAYGWQHPGAFFDRLTNNGTLQSGWLQHTMASTGQNAGQVLAERVIHAFLSLFYYAPFDFYGSPVPILNRPTAAVFMLGLGIALFRLRRPGYLLLNGYFWAGTCAIGLFAIPPSADTYRMLIVLPAALMMAAVGLDGVLQAIGFGWSSARREHVTATVLVFAGLFIFNFWTYFINFARSCQYAGDSPPARFASYLGRYVHSVSREHRVLLLSNDTYFYGSHPSVDFLSGSHPIANIRASADTLQPNAHDTVIATPDRIEELKAWAATHPGGTLHYEHDCQRPILLAYRFP